MRGSCLEYQGRGCRYSPSLQSPISILVVVWGYTTADRLYSGSRKHSDTWPSCFNPSSLQPNWMYYSTVCTSRERVLYATYIADSRENFIRRLICRDLRDGQDPSMFYFLQYVLSMTQLCPMPSGKCTGSSRITNRKSPTPPALRTFAPKSCCVPMYRRSTGILRPSAVPHLLLVYKRGGGSDNPGQESAEFVMVAIGRHKETREKEKLIESPRARFG
ncbi:hypothetical protein BXZ70DRAFT_243850 [Cristinia sonorae]|uniref:Uncharacterized protein n=1 Tax=Cristinia sonorae TaxID=1940300 RepID=A0A8K0UZ20_9AGAR|nr:hypothetical protein BXZ70DRAFT_243850 [Cristinia sonorae]